MIKKRKTRNGGAHSKRERKKCLSAIDTIVRTIATMKLI